VNRSKLLSGFLFFCALLFSGSLLAETWKPLCPVGSTCNAPYQQVDYRTQYSDFVTHMGDGLLNPDAVGPLETNAGFLLFQIPISYPSPLVPKGETFRWSSRGLEYTGLASHFAEEDNFSDFRMVELANGDILSMEPHGMILWTLSSDGENGFQWKQHGPMILNLADFSYPPVAVGGVTYMAMKLPSGTQTVWVSHDLGHSWDYERSNIQLGEDRYNLLSNPETDALWAMSAETAETPASLWESVDDGVNWTQVDDGSFPLNTMRVVHDPDHAQVSYALTTHGLFVSRNRGVSWQVTELSESVNGLAFVAQGASIPAAMVAGTASGITLSLDGGESWTHMSKGLLNGSYTVAYADGQLLATGEGGYFTCNGLDCTGPAQVFPPSDGEGLIEVVEYFNTILKHYFMTGSTGEKAMLDQANAAAGWQRTGESFLAWAPGHNYLETSNVCRFYGSQVLGPNSHFYSDTALECRMLQGLQEATPNDQSRWNFEGWGMSVMPRAASNSQPCPENATPVFRAYNNGFALGKDSNHRYMTDPALVASMQEQGWIDEGIAFCSPTE
jgi:hypothetical protein